MNDPVVLARDGLIIDPLTGFVVEGPCEKCTAANREYQRNWRKTRQTVSSRDKHDWRNRTYGRALLALKGRHEEEFNRILDAIRTDTPRDM